MTEKWQISHSPFMNCKLKRAIYWFILNANQWLQTHNFALSLRLSTCVCSVHHSTEYYNLTLVSFTHTLSRRLAVEKLFAVVDMPSATPIP